MEEAVTTKEIVETIAKETESDLSLPEVRATQPAFGGRKNTTVILPNDETKILMQKGMLKIGWTFCKIPEKQRLGM